MLYVTLGTHLNSSGQKETPGGLCVIQKVRKLRQEGWIWVLTLQLSVIVLGTEALLHLERNSKIPSFPELLEDLSRLMWG